MIRIYAIAALLALALGLAWNGQHQAQRAVAAETALASATAQLLQVERAETVHRQHVASEARRWAAFEATLAEVETMEGADAPLSDYLRAVDQRLR